jgi:hypothetical protein
MGTHLFLSNVLLLELLQLICVPLEHRQHCKWNTAVVNRTPFRLRQACDCAAGSGLCMERFSTCDHNLQYARLPASPFCCCTVANQPCGLKAWPSS